MDLHGLVEWLSEHLLSKSEALSPNSSATKKNRNGPLSLTECCPTFCLTILYYPGNDVCVCACLYLCVDAIC
jgi:hypothetical protein